MRFNEKELALFAASFEPDKEGLLEKKGAGKGQGYKARWFRLKGNLLFYYKVDESGGWESSDPVGVIVLEGCTVKIVNIESHPYAFSLEFQDDDARTYILVASSQPELDSWTDVLKVASYEGLREMKLSLQKQLSELTGLPTEADDISHRSQRMVNRKMTLLSVSVNEERAKRLLFSCQTLSQDVSSQFALSLKCTHLPPNKNREPPSTMVVVQCYDAHQRKLLSTISRTEIVEASCDSFYSHTPLLTIGPTSPGNGFLKFEVLAMHKTTQALGSESEGSSPGEYGSEDEGTCKLQALPESLGFVWCSVNDIMKASNGDREIVHKLSHANRGQRSGVLHISVTKFDGLSSVERPRMETHAADPTGLLQSIMKAPTRSCFTFPQLNSVHRVKVIEEKAASVFNILVPIELLKCYLKEDQQHIEVLNDIGPLNDLWTERLQNYQVILYEALATYHQTVKELENLADTCDFKPYSMRGKVELQFVPCGLHIQKMRVKPHGKPESVYCFTTLGCPAHHIGGFESDGGLQRRLEQTGGSPCFLTQWKDGRSSTVKCSLESILSIRRNIARMKDQLYIASGNRHSDLMIDTVEAISKQIQNLLSIMESTIVEEAIENLRSSRPWISACSAESVQNKRASVRKSRCIVLSCPSDWVWNGKKLVRVSLQQWQLRDSNENIQRNLKLLNDAVQVAAREVVDQQHLAVAAEVGAGFTTFKPTYVWSSVLIPLIEKLNQTVNGLISIAQLSLSFRLMQLNSSVEGLKALKLRRDVVFSHAVTALLTSFYITLSQLYTSPAFLKQLKEVGFLVHFESIISATDGEVGVLEDMCVAVAELSTIRIQLSELPHSSSNIMFDIDISGTRENLKIRLLFSSSYFKHMPDKMLVAGEPISVTPVLFTQLVDTHEVIGEDTNRYTERTRNLLQLEQDINSSGMEAITEYVERVSQLALDPGDTQDALKAKSLLTFIKNQFATQSPKPSDFSTAIQQVCRLVKGGRLTSCETGDVQTGLSVTEEENCILVTSQHIDRELSAKSLSILKSHGVWSSCRAHS